jgi:hypothetical protein
MPAVIVPLPVVIDREDQGQPRNTSSHGAFVRCVRMELTSDPLELLCKIKSHCLLQSGRPNVLLGHTGHKRSMERTAASPLC